MTTLARMQVELIARTDAFLRDMDKAKGKIQSTAKGFVEAGKAIAAGWVVKEIIRNTSEAEAAFAQLTAAVKSTGGAAGFSAHELREQAGAMQQVSTFSDEAVQHMQAVLLTFTKVRGDNFTKASTAIADMATRMGTDLKSAALQVGKALQDPVKGATALARAGVQLSDSQKALIADLVKVGDVAGAQTVILKELETQFGGSAAAARNTLGGALTHLKNVFGDLFEVTGNGTSAFIASINAMAVAVKAFGAVVNTTFSVIDETFRRVANIFNGLQKDIGFMSDAEEAAFQKAKQSMLARAAAHKASTDAIVKQTEEEVEAQQEAAEKLSKAISTEAEKIREEIIELTKGKAALEQYRLEKLIAGKVPPIVSAQELRDLATYRNKLELIAKEVDVLQGSAGSNKLELMPHAPIAALPEASKAAALEIKRGFGDVINDFVLGFEKVTTKLGKALQSIVSDVFGDKLGKIIGTSFSAALVPIIGGLLGTIVNFLSGLDFGGSGSGEPLTPGGNRRKIAFVGPTGVVYSTKEDKALDAQGTSPTGATPSSGITSITSHAATATLAQEERLIGLVSTLVSLTRQHIAATVATGRRVVLSDTVQDDANRSDYTAGNAVIA